MHMKLGVSGIAVALVLIACTSSSSDFGTPPGGDGGAGGSCTDAPLAASCLDDDNAAIFVSANGSDVLGDGVRARPLRTIGAALGKMTATRRRIYVCEGRYDEDLFLGPQHAALVLVGGVDCAWKPNGSRPVVGQTGSGTSPESTPITILRGEAPIVIDGIEARAADAPLAPELYETKTSSIVARVNGEVIFRRVHFVAGRGSNGHAGAPIRSSKDVLSLPLDGVGGSVTCGAGGESHGGNAPGGAGTPGPANGGAAGAACDAGGNGKDGINGTDGTDGAGATKLGVLQRTPEGTQPKIIAAWKPTAGAAGTYGTAGQGGGAGDGASGGGGGAGSCSAEVGGGGQAGGASIAILAVGARITLRDSILETAAGGAGGDGADRGTDGGPGQLGASVTAGACTGGRGGVGGRGGSGGGGAGGVSIGVLHSEPPPDIDKATLDALVVGAAGKAGKTSGNPKAIDGVSQPTLQIDEITP